MKKLNFSVLGLLVLCALCAQSTVSFAQSGYAGVLMLNALSANIPTIHLREGSVLYLNRDARLAYWAFASTRAQKFNVISHTTNQEFSNAQTTLSPVNESESSNRGPLICGTWLSYTMHVLYSHGEKMQGEEVIAHLVQNGVNPEVQHCYNPQFENLCLRRQPIVSALPNGGTRVVRGDVNCEKANQLLERVD